jgi:hypothetical protein
MRLVGVMETTARYADVRDPPAREQVARAERDRLLHQVELRWEALSTAAAWLAAHHAYVVAVDEARIATSGDLTCHYISRKLDAFYFS